MDIRNYYVVGGEYADTNFETLAPGATEERYGPFSEKEAHDTWRSLTGKTVDNALVRYRIKPGDAVSDAVWFVVGGEYADVDFARIATGQKLETYGPFSRPEALAVWRSITAKTVDSALTRYDIVTVEELDVIKKTA
ncbi:DUF4170 domain-containing protein [Telmatospirillum siberiense]|uniref:DUF4170 domain-containing protein n=1 Tax=Telmatospirillum siberiense TaxID=382514 RepID=A0A2N3PU30_9PROT|nr:DUF4170 domain-containing protein [Telmatospirillum siberiense]PKU23900.1 DUF4170 domain-containing protein [Telmatospirillum siberiense]